MVKICTTRFNRETLQENIQWKKLKNKTTHCVYGSPSMLKQSIKENEWIIVLEMHNDINKIIGLGLMRNIPIKNNNIYSFGNYNRYTYEGHIRIDLSNVDTSLSSHGDDDDTKDDVLTREERIVIRILELSLFYGQKHSKRAKGICELPSRINMLYDFKDCLKGIFSRHSKLQNYSSTIR
jgi:hypothetical protein